MFLSTMGLQAEPHDFNSLPLSLQHAEQSQGTAYLLDELHKYWTHLFGLEEIILQHFTLSASVTFLFLVLRTTHVWDSAGWEAEREGNTCKVWILENQRWLCQMHINCKARSLGDKVIIPCSYGLCTPEVVSALKNKKRLHIWRNTQI